MKLFSKNNRANILGLCILALYKVDDFGCFRSLDPKNYITMRGHNSRVNAISSFDESNYILSASSDKTSKQRLFIL